LCTIVARFEKGGCIDAYFQGFATGEFRGHHANQACYKSGIMPAEYALPQTQCSAQIGVYDLHISPGHSPKSAIEHVLLYCSYDARRHRRKEQAGLFPVLDDMVACQYPVGPTCDCHDHGVLTGLVISV
jgi:hypothetical protein